MFGGLFMPKAVILALLKRVASVDLPEILVEVEKGISKIQKVYVQSQASYSVISNESIKRRKPQFI